MGYSEGRRGEAFPMRFLNGFVLIGIILLLISIAGLVSGNTLLTEPGQPVNQYAWEEYLAAAALMLINGAVSIWNARRHGPDDPQKSVSQETKAPETPEAVQH